MLILLRLILQEPIGITRTMPVNIQMDFADP